MTEKLLNNRKNGMMVMLELIGVTMVCVAG